ncbi:M36 family metallopeptidase, partial [Algoriella sp.]|uniref:M36 family metallopeptidase n=1 Tax=Algoriella sp. TaxID=1872434 RepID=UPI001B20292C
MKKNFTLIFSAFLLSMTAQAQNAEQLINNYQAQRTGNNVEYKFVQTINDENDQTQRVFTQRTFQGIPVYNSYTTYLVKNNQVVSSFASENYNSDFKTVNVTPTLNLNQALNNVAQLEGLKLITDEASKDYGVHFSKEETSELVYYINDKQEPILSYALSYRLFKENQNDVIHVIVDAKNGTILDKHNTTLSCSFDHGSFHNENLATFNKTDWNWLYDDNTNTASPQYNVYKLPLEAPNRGARTFVDLSASNTTASPNGWHNIAEETVKTRTEGNNVRAASDHKSIGYQTYNSGANTVTLSNEDYADGGSALNFDFPVDFNLDPYKNWQASTTNLFYMNNMMHDILYNYGFTEVNGNFQKDNYGKGATGNDNVVALAQTGMSIGVMNNATFATPADGRAPRMAMYLWNPPATADIKPLTINSPANIAGKLNVSKAPFGADLPTTPLTKDLVLVRKSETDGTEFDGCGTITNATEITDKIAILQRGGNCDFVTKVKNAQNAGAKAVIITNNIAGNITITGQDSTITIPVVGLPRIDGEKIKKELVNGTTVNASLQHKDIPYSDGSFDNGIIAHEYGHGISNRLTGPITNSNCLSNLEQMGEGWSDFFALMLTQ